MIIIEKKEKANYLLEEAEEERRLSILPYMSHNLLLLTRPGRRQNSIE